MLLNMPKNKILEEISSSSSSEYYNPFPKNYKIGKTKYIIVAGSVISGSGKGIFSSSISKLLKDGGIKVEPLKIDGYFNQDAGTLNPYRHGEVFVLKDGLECDMDLGSYERFLNQDLLKYNYLTSGMIFRNVLEKERKGKYLGRDVQFIPHVTGEVKLALRNLSLKTNAEVIVIEIGGTIGDYENSYIIEAMREFRQEEGKENICFINISYIIKPSSLGEQKSKPAQLGLNRLMGLGIQPDMIICRAEEPVDKKIIQKISLYSNVNSKYVTGLHNTSTVYEAPLVLKNKKVDEKIVEFLNIKKFNLKKQKKELTRWSKFVKRYTHPSKTINIGIAGKYTGLKDSYASIIKALEHSGTFLNTKINIKFIDTTQIKNEDQIIKIFEDIQGIIVPGGFGKRGVEGKIKCIQFARENNIPFLGLCFGFQMAVIEFARHVCNLKNANSTEIDPLCKYPVINILPEQKELEGLGGNMRLGGHKVLIKQDSYAYQIYKQKLHTLRFRHRYEVDPKFIKQLESKGLSFSGKSPKYDIMQILELKNNDFFMATQAHPEFNSKPLKPEPLFLEFVRKSIKQ